jgi:hypothetical protein
MQRRSFALQPLQPLQPQTALSWLSPVQTKLYFVKKVPISPRGVVCVLLFLDLDIDRGSSNLNGFIRPKNAKPVNALCECPGALSPSPSLRLIYAASRSQGCVAVLMRGPKTTNSINLQSRTDAIAAIN